MRVLALITAAALAACGSSASSTRAAPPVAAPVHALPALFAHVPAGTPYLVAAIDPLGAEDLKLAEAIIGPGISDALPKYPAVAPFIDALRAELGGAWTVERWEALGFAASPRFAIYGLGVYPVARIEVRDADKVAATLGRLATRLGGALAPPEARGNRRYWRIERDVSFVLALGDGELVLAAGPRAYVDAHLDEILGVTSPAQSLADGKGLLALLDRHKLGRHFVALFETHPMIEQVIALSGTPPTRECRDRLDALALLLPRFIIGHAKSAPHQMTFAAILELTGDLLADAHALRTQVPAITHALDGQPIAAMAGAIDLPATATLVHAISGRLSELGGACNAPDLRTAADAMDAKIDVLSSGLASTVTGFALSVHTLVPGAGTKIPAQLDALAFVTSTDAQQLFTAMMSIQPALGTFGLAADNTLHELNIGVLGLPFPVYAGISDRAFIFASGESEKARATAALADATPRPFPLLAMTYDYTRFTDLERAFGLLTESEATVTTRTHLFGRGTFTVDVDSSGIAMWSKVDLK